MKLVLSAVLFFSSCMTFAQVYPEIGVNVKEYLKSQEKSIDLTLGLSWEDDYTSVVEFSLEKGKNLNSQSLKVIYDIFDGMRDSDYFWYVGFGIQRLEFNKDFPSNSDTLKRSISMFFANKIKLQLGKRVSVNVSFDLDFTNWLRQAMSETTLNYKELHMNTKTNFGMGVSYKFGSH